MNQHLDEAPEQELEFVRFHQLEKPKKTFFYQKKDSEGDVIEDTPIFACSEQEAGMFGKFHKLMGVSNGQAYYNSIKNAMVDVRCEPCLGKKTIEQAVEENGHTIMKKLPCEACQGLGHVQKKLRSGMVLPISEATRILQEAFDAEWAAAKGHKEKPHYSNVIFDASFPIKQRDSFVPPA